MKIVQDLQQGLRRLWAAIVRNFSPSRDDYPESGVQPYGGDPYEGD